MTRIRPPTATERAGAPLSRTVRDSHLQGIQEYQRQFLQESREKPPPSTDWVDQVCITRLESPRYCLTRTSLAVQQIPDVAAAHQGR